MTSPLRRSRRGGRSASAAAIAAAPCAARAASPAARACARRSPISTSASASSATRRAASRARSSAAAEASARERERSARTSRPLRAAASASAAARRVDARGVERRLQLRERAFHGRHLGLPLRREARRLRPALAGFREVLSERVALLGEDAQLLHGALFLRARGGALRLGLGMRALGGTPGGEGGVERRGERSDLLARGSRSRRPRPPASPRRLSAPRRGSRGRAGP